MTTEILTSEQQAFLEECALEFSDRYTDADIEYKKIYDNGIPPPPIMYPWSIRRFNKSRDRAGGSGYRDDRNYRDHNQQNYDREERGYKDHSYQQDYRDNHRDRYNSHRIERSYRP